MTRAIRVAIVISIISITSRMITLMVRIGRIGPIINIIIRGLMISLLMKRVEDAEPKPIMVKGILHRIKVQMMKS